MIFENKMELSVFANKLFTHIYIYMYTDKANNMYTDKANNMI